MLVNVAKPDRKRSRSVSLHESTLDDIAAYQRMYEAEAGHPIDTSPLVEALLKAAFEKDKDFQRFKRDEGKAKKNGGKTSGKPDESTAETPAEDDKSGETDKPEGRRRRLLG